MGVGLAKRATWPTPWLSPRTFLPGFPPYSICQLCVVSYSTWLAACMLMEYYERYMANPWMSYDMPYNMRHMTHAISRTPFAFCSIRQPYPTPFQVRHLPFNSYANHVPCVWMPGNDGEGSQSREKCAKAFLDNRDLSL